MKRTRLGINSGFAVNRYPEPSVWPRLVGEVFGLRYAKFAADLLNPSLPSPLVKMHLKEIKAACKKYDVTIEHSFTSAFTRVNHLASPDRTFRKYWVTWFKKFVDISVALGATSMGSHLAILTATDFADAKRRQERTRQVIEGWHEIAAYAKKRGMTYLTWEPMSVGREFGETIAATQKLQAMLNAGSPLPIKLCLDVDHGDLTSKNPDDTDPYAWIKKLGKQSPIIDLKQSLKSKGGHYPFIAEYNAQGKIVPEKILETIERYGADDTMLYFEFSFRERNPADRQVIPHIKESVEYWRPFVAN